MMNETVQGATAAPPQQPPKPTKSRYWSQLFFIRRRPMLRGVPREWERPQTEDEYQKLIHDEGFVSIKYWEGDDISRHPVLTRDIRDLDEYLLPTFFQFSTRSKFYQNRFYLYQWVFVWGAFLTTVAGTLATLFSFPPTIAGNVAFQAQDAALVTPQQVLSYLTAGIGALTAFITALSQRGEPQKRWGKTRRLTEELRMHYFNYLSHLAPYDGLDRLRKLRENVIDIRVKEQENV